MTNCVMNMKTGEMEMDKGDQGFKKTCKTTRHGVGAIEIGPRSSNDSYEGHINSETKETKFLRSEVHHMYQSYPFAFRTPENCTNSVCRWIYPITFGGGLVGGDQIAVKFVICERCCVVVCTQEITKVYHCLQSQETTQQVLDFTVKEHSLLCVLPDPLVCYKDARFDQKQTFQMSPSSNLVLLDWLQAGRQALGEFWDFERYCNTIEIFLSEKLVLHECTDMETTPMAVLKKCMGKFQFMGTCIILGPYLAPLIESMEEKYGCKIGFGEKHTENLKVSVSPLSYSVNDGQLHGCYIRFLATDMRAASVIIKDITKPLLVDLGADPFERKL